MLYTNEVVDLDRLERKIKVLRIDSVILADLILITSEASLKIDSDLPDDIKIVGCEFERTHDRGNYIVLELYSDSFDEVPRGEEWPAIDDNIIKLTRLYPDD